MAFPINGDLVPSSSGIANLGVDGSIGDAFDITSIAPFGHVHLNSGVFHHPHNGQSGVLRYAPDAVAGACFEVSVDGGNTFNCVRTTSSAGVDSVGVLGDTNLTGDVDFASPGSGFIAIEDSANSSPLLWSVDQLGLSGLWGFPTQGFNGRVVNALTDSNGTEAQGVINVIGVSGLLVDIVGQTMTIGTTFDNGFATCYEESFSPATTWVATHNFGTEAVIVNTQNNSSPKLMILPDRIQITDTNTVTVTWNTAQAGRIIIMACKSS